MSQVIVTDRSEQETCIEFTPGMSLMQTIYEADVSDMLALCGGVCSCGTCHVYIDEASAVAFNDLPAQSDDESLLLDASSHRNSRSRLACQVVLKEEYDQLRVTIAPED